jgi:hypothetical protein
LVEPVANMLNYETLLQEMLLHPPDPNEVLPVINRRATILGIVLPFLV